MKKRSEIIMQKAGVAKATSGGRTELLIEAILEYIDERDGPAPEQQAYIPKKKPDTGSLRESSHQDAVKLHWDDHNGVRQTLNAEDVVLCLSAQEPELLTRLVRMATQRADLWNATARTPSGRSKLLLLTDSGPIIGFYGSEGKWLAYDHDGRTTYLDQGVVLGWRELP